MQHETATVKKVVKRYKTVNGDEKESISYNAKVSAKSGFKDGDEVVIIPADDFDEINNVDVAETVLIGDVPDTFYNLQGINDFTTDDTMNMM